jgi:diguanylate cyclase (GGDEF)-like protein
VLRLFGEVCGNNLRASDLVGRIGGEEFAILLADASRDNAFFVAERLRAAFEDAGATLDGEALGATVSVGVALTTQGSEPLNGLLKQADQALYRAKTRGRNRVELAPLETELPEPAAQPDVAPSNGVRAQA